MCFHIIREHSGSGMSDEHLMTVLKPIENFNEKEQLEYFNASLKDTLVTLLRGKRS